MSAVAVHSFWSDWTPVAGVVGGFATGLAAAFAGGAIWYARSQIRSSSALAREQEAQRVYSDYLHLCIDRPEFTSSEIFMRQFAVTDIEDIQSVLTKESEGYLWFVSYMLSACEKIHVTSRSDADWLQCIRSQIGYHKPVLKVLWQDIAYHYHSDFRAIVGNELN